MMNGELNLMDKVFGVLEMVLQLFVGTETEHIADANVYPQVHKLHSKQ
jgi:hypothetical protein